MSKYAIVDEDGNVVNTITWDGSTPYDPGEGKKAVPAPDDVNIGWKQDGEKWVGPGGGPVIEPPAPPPAAAEGGGEGESDAPAESEPRVPMEPPPAEEPA